MTSPQFVQFTDANTRRQRVVRIESVLAAWVDQSERARLRLRDGASAEVVECEESIAVIARRLGALQ